MRDRDPAELRDMLERPELDELLRLTHRELGSPHSAFSRAVLMHARGLALAHEDARLAEAIGDLERVLGRPQAEQEESAKAFGPVWWHLADVYARWRALGGEYVVAEVRGLPALLVTVSSALREHRPEVAEPLLTRALEVVESGEGPAAPRYRALISLLRVLREELGDLLGAAIDVADAENEARLEQLRFSWPADRRDEYFGVLDALAGAAAAGSLRELAWAFNGIGLDVHQWAAEQASAYETYVERLVAQGEYAVAAGRYAHAHGLSAEITDLCQAGRCAPAWERTALVIRGCAWVWTHEYALGMAALREGVAGGHPRDAPTWRVTGLLDLYRAALEVDDFEQAARCHAELVALGDPMGTSTVEIEARATEREERGQAIALYRQLLAGEAKLSTRSRATPRLLALLLADGQAEAAVDEIGPLHELLATYMGAKHPALSDVEELWAAIASACGDNDAALAMLFSATDRDSREAPRSLGVGTATQRNRMLTRFRRRTEAAVSLVVDHYAADSERVGGVHAVVLRQQGLRVDVEADARGELRTAGQLAHDIGRAVGQLRTRLIRAAFEDAPAAALARLLAEKEAQDYELSARVGATIGVMTQANPMSVAMGIPEGAAYIDYCTYAPPHPPGADPPPRRYCAFVVHARMVGWYLAGLGDADAIDALVAEFRQAIVACDAAARDMLPTPAAQANATLEEAGRRLRERVFDPLAGLLGGRTRLVVSPDGALYTLPLDALPAADGGHLIDDYTFSYVPSARSALTMPPDIIRGADWAPGAPPVIVGAPDYGEADGPARFGPLDGARSEADAVAGLLDVTAVIGPAATKSLLTSARAPLILHLATHGYFIEQAAAARVLADVPFVRTGIALAKANGPGGHGILTGEEVASLALDGTALAVLSACETGLGESLHGEGVASLARAFHGAGAAAVVAGLWKVPDRETAELMIEFYRALAAGRTCADALRDAKLALRATRSEPYAWGAFVCSGVSGTIATGNWTAAA